MPTSRAAPRHVFVWRAAATSVVVVAGLVAGLVITNSRPPAGDPTAATSEPPSSETSAIPSTEAPSIVPPPVPPGTWERIDLADPAPGAFTYTHVNDVVAFNGEYVAIGMLGAYCGSDIYQDPPDCEAVVSALPTASSSAVWISEDARTWEQLPLRDDFEAGRMEHAATDGERIVVVGVGRDDQGEELPRVAWVSDDGRDWQLVGPAELIPERVVATTEGFIGSRPTDNGPQFVASEDGRIWRALTDPGELGPGHVAGLAVGRDRVTVVAVGATYEDGDQVRTATSWLGRDHGAWERAPANDGHDGAEMIAAADTGAGWVAVGVDQWVRSAMSVWTSPDGLIWTRGDDVSAPFGGPSDIAWTGEQIVVAGTVGGESSSVIAFWLSPDAMSWETVVRDRANDAGSPNRITAFDGWVIAVGSRSTGPDHGIGAIWLAAP